MRLFPRLYKFDTKGKVRIWDIYSEENTFIVEHGLDGGKIQQKITNCKPKNIGKSNETTPEEQAEKEAVARWEKQIRIEDYAEDINNSGLQNRPMLAHDYRKVPHRVKWYDSICQFKIDGCFTEDMRVLTSKGYININLIKIGDSVISYNKDKNILEPNKVINVFNNGESNDFVKISTYNNKQRDIKNNSINVTNNHEMLSNGKWKKVSDLNVGDYLTETKNIRQKNSIILGMLLGDGCLSTEKRKLYKNRESFRLIYSQVNTKEKTLNHIIKLSGLSGRIYKHKSGYGSNILSFTSKAITFSGFNVNKLFNLDVNSNNYGSRVDIPYKYLKSNFNIESLSIWYSSDGSIRYNNSNKLTPILSLSTSRYSYNQIRDFVKLFQCLYNCIPTIIQDKRHVRSDGTFQESLIFNTKDSLYLYNQLKGYVIDDMEYKYYFNNNKNEFKEFNEFENDIITKIEPLKRYYTKYDIEVENNHNYIINDRIVHNCRLLGGYRWDDAINIELMSRKGEVYPIGHFQRPTEELLEIIIDELGYNCHAIDGEAYIHGMKLQHIVSLARKNKAESFDLRYYLFDLVMYHTDFKKRFNILTEALDLYADRHDGNIYPFVLVDVTDVINEDEMKEFHGKAIEQGYEGAMIRHCNGLYKRGRSADLFKYKEFFDVECKIIGMKSDNNDNAMLVVIAPNGEDLDVTPKRTHNERKEMLKRPEDYIGKWITVKYQSLTESGNLQFPIGLDIRECSDDGTPIL